MGKGRPAAPGALCARSQAETGETLTTLRSRLRPGSAAPALGASRVSSRAANAVAGMEVGATLTSEISPVVADRHGA